MSTRAVVAVDTLCAAVLLVASVRSIDASVPDQLGALGLSVAALTATLAVHVARLTSMRRGLASRARELQRRA